MRRVVQGVKGILIGLFPIGILETFPQGCSEGLNQRKDHPPILGQNGPPWNKIKEAIGPAFLLPVKLIKVQCLDQRLFSEFRFFLHWQVVQIPATGIVLINNLEAEILAADLEAPNGVDVFHHQVPDRPVDQG